MFNISSSTYVAVGFTFILIAILYVLDLKNNLIIIVVLLLPCWNSYDYLAKTINFIYKCLVDVKKQHCI